MTDIYTLADVVGRRFKLMASIKARVSDLKTTARNNGNVFNEDSERDLYTFVESVESSCCPSISVTKAWGSEENQITQDNTSLLAVWANSDQDTQICLQFLGKGKIHLIRCSYWGGAATTIKGFLSMTGTIQEIADQVEALGPNTPLNDISDPLSLF
jgi:hypothetical protein